MGALDKAKNAAQDAKGKVQETVGRVTGNEDTEAEGQVEQVEADLKQRGESLKDAVNPDR